MPHDILIHDPIYTFISVPAYIAEVIDTPEFQRLRNIRQLATVHYRFPGGHHSRFEHCLGTFHIARTFLEFLISDRENGHRRYIPSSRDIQLEVVPPRITRYECEVAALLHDIGHGPFGHTMDFLLDRLGFPEEKRHEYFGVKKIHDQNTQLCKKLNAAKTDSGDSLDIDNIASLIHGRPPVREKGKEFAEWENLKYSYLGHLTSEFAVSADRIDYLIRDAYYTGVRMVGLDLTGILEGLRVFLYRVPGHPDKIEADLAFDFGSIWTIEAMLLSHTAMYKTVYHNTTHRILQEMVVRAFEAYIEKEFHTGNPANMSEEDVYKIMNWSDYDAVTELRNHKESKTILDRVLERRPYSKVIELPWSHMPSTVQNRIKRGEIKTIDIPQREEEMAKKCGLGPRELIISLPTLKYPDLDIHLIRTVGEGKVEQTTLDAESEIAKAMTKIPFVDRMIVAVADEKKVEKTRSVVQEVFQITLD